MRHKWWTIFIVAFVVMVIAMFTTAKKVEQKKFVTMDITRGDISQTVTATGEIMPLNTVSVGSQVSGTIEEIFVDFVCFNFFATYLVLGELIDKLIAIY